MMVLATAALGASIALAGCDPEMQMIGVGEKVPALEDAAWACSKWISAADQKVLKGTGHLRAADGVSWFVNEFVNAKTVKKAMWMTTGLGVYEVYVNRRAVGGEFLKPGFTHARKTRRSFTYDVTAVVRRGAGEKNELAAEVSHGWWSDKIVSPSGQDGMTGKKPAFRGVLELTYEDDSVECFGTDEKHWKAGVGGPVTHAAIFDGEEYDATISRPWTVAIGALKTPEINEEFNGEILPSEGAEVYLRRDLAMTPTRAYVYDELKGSGGDSQGDVVVKREFDPLGEMVVEKGETLVVDFGQNAAAVPVFRFRANAGTKLTCLPSELLNDAGGKKSRGMDGPGGSCHRRNLRCPDVGMRIIYKFGLSHDGCATYWPRHTFFGYRFLSITATDRVEIKAVMSVPVTSIVKEMEIGTIKTGHRGVNQLISNARWGQRSNYLSVSTDCPQRNERLGWTADTQVFCETGAFFANTARFFRKWMRDMRDSQGLKGGFPGVAPWAQYGADENCMMRLGWADAGIIVPFKIWRMFGDQSLIDDNWDAMARFMAHVNETKYEHGAIKSECDDYQWADWLSLEKFTSCIPGPQYKHLDVFSWKGGKRSVISGGYDYWDFLAANYWLWDAEMMSTMATATGRDAEKYRKMAENAKAYLKERFIDKKDGMVLEIFRDMQSPAVFALKSGLLEGEALEKTKDALRENIKAHGGCHTTGFLGTSVLMDTLTENGMADVAYDLLFNRNFPGWMYSIDQGATTIWERWNSYTKADGMGPAGMNSFNHYAYGCVCAWIWKTAAGIAPDERNPGFQKIIMRPVPDRRLGYITAEYKSAAGLVKSAWRYEGDTWVWKFTIPKGATAEVTLPNETVSHSYTAGDYVIRK